MLVTSLTPKDVSDLLEMEEKMYWQSPEWAELWETKGKERFESFIKDYLKEFNPGCIGLENEGKILVYRICTTLPNISNRAAR